MSYQRLYEHSEGIIEIAGTSYRENIAQIEPSLEIGQMFIMIREPENQYDCRAIAIYLNDYKLG